MAKITFLGAGSTIFARNVLGDCMCTPSLCESEVALYDIDDIITMCDEMIEAHGDYMAWFR